MRIEGIGNLTSLAGTGPLKASAAAADGPGFADTIKTALGEVNELQSMGDMMAQKLATGDVEDIHQVMLALNKASTAFGLTVQVRNKVIESYQEVMRMQV